ncbi:MAG: helicase-associated domain-containing protein, partial [Alicyclobacillus sp.]|nr:helicase-associated domain-containing protein [Alicyclobacillus sp.]
MGIGLYVQNDGTLVVRTDAPEYPEARRQLVTFAELVQRLDPIHVYQIRPLSLWQAASAGWTARAVMQCLRSWAEHPLPYALQQMIVTEMAKWGRLHLHQGGRGRLLLRGDESALQAVRNMPEVMRLCKADRMDGLQFASKDRADVKRRLASAGFPVIDQAGYQVGQPLPCTWNDSGRLRGYQQEAVQRFLAGEPSGVVVLPCGSGKTWVGIAVLCALQVETLVLVPTETAARQWQRELLAHTTLSAQ